MTSRELVRKVLNQEEVERIPRHLWYLPGIGLMRNQELQEVIRKYPCDIDSPRFRYGTGKKSRGEVGEVGRYVDEWGSVWHVAQRGVLGEVKEPALDDWSKFASFVPPWEVLAEADFSEVDRSCAESDSFMLVATNVRPFERLQFLRGTESLFMDLAYGDARIYKLRDLVHEFFLKELELWVKTDVDGILFMDDWGSQNALLISPKLWREFFKPLYIDYCNLIKKHGKYVFFHSDGNIEAIFNDLIEIGIDAINCQLFCMDLEKLGDMYAGKITFYGEIDRQYILPFGNTDDVRNAVRRVAKALIKGKKTGVIASANGD